MPQTSTLNIYVCAGISFIGWFNDYHTLSHGFSVPDTTSRSRKAYDMNRLFQPWVFACFCILLKACVLLERPETSSLIIDVCVGIGFNGWFNDYNTLPHGFSHVEMSTRNEWGQAVTTLGLLVVFFLKACLLSGSPQTLFLNKYVCVGIRFIGWFNDNGTLPHDIMTSRND